MAEYFENPKTGEKSTMRYIWRAMPYEKKVNKFGIMLQIVPTILTGLNDYTDYPKVHKFVEEKLKPLGFEERRSLYSAVVLWFDKSYNDVIIKNKIGETIKLLNEIGLVFSGNVDMLHGFPDLTYGQKYLEHTTSVEFITILDLVKLLSNNDTNVVETFKKEFNTHSSTIFRPDIDTDTSYLSNYLNEKIKKLENKIKEFSKTTEELFGKKHKFIYKNKETYSTEDSSDYSAFQGHWI